ncbi:SDR family oxidoreductase [Photobacterium halotolerans]|uniref:SDR family oxidoreductase n=1 Tax=Photobacterium halotolerans TaxID=265726 RepID=A0A7X4WU69_9GAMM|nr:SDR family oxidoreductase [Photobacterium halotolerans]NAW63695.1 SDR family oxidoreductase [Photobacterium halotolerans]NAW88900.1 SDR family oxidoreductase [Photobacterium halotolerans]
MQLNDAVVFISGANRGLGLAFATEALARGARKVYAGARDPNSVTLPGVIAVKLDVTSEEDIASAAAQCTDVTLLINNAGIAETGSFLNIGAEAMFQRQLEVNVLGPLRLTRAFAPVLAQHGGGAIINVLSVASWITGPLLATYAATKSAAWSLTNALRQELTSQHTHVLGLHAGFIDTDLTTGIDAPKVTAESVVNAAFDGLQQGDLQVLADEITQQVHQALSPHPQVYLLAAE